MEFTVVKLRQLLVESDEQARRAYKRLLLNPKDVNSWVKAIREATHAGLALKIDYTAHFRWEFVTSHIDTKSKWLDVYGWWGGGGGYSRAVLPLDRFTSIYTTINSIELIRRPRPTVAEPHGKGDFPFTG